MTSRDKIGVLLLVLLFTALCLVLVWTVKPHGPAHAPKDSIFVQQRIKNLEKSR